MRERALAVPAAAVAASALFTNPTVLMTLWLLLCSSLHKSHVSLLQLLCLPIWPYRPLGLP